MGQHRIAVIPGDGIGKEVVPEGMAPRVVCVQDPERVESEEELFARAKKIHPDRADELVLSASTSHFRS